MCRICLHEALINSSDTKTNLIIDSTFVITGLETCVNNIPTQLRTPYSVLVEIRYTVFHSAQAHRFMTDRIQKDQHLAPSVAHPPPLSTTLSVSTPNKRNQNLKWAVHIHQRIMTNLIQFEATGLIERQREREEGASMVLIFHKQQRGQRWEMPNR